ncbi:hypothetical protein [Methanoregula sp.]|jgi:hypothetical protein|uniref:hypothetical protein n=1 Tax=Methanoregula sp. TaxID=2052170 RepID=UPI003C26476B
MKNKKLYLICCTALLLIIAATGCVAPPKDTSAVVTYTFNPDGGTPTNTTSASYVTEVTPYINSHDSSVCQTATLGFTTFVSPTPPPSDKSCLIKTTTQTFMYNGTAFTFDLKNPPMYINYTVIPTNITVNKAATSQYLSKEDVTYQFSTYDPQSYFEITVRNKTSGEIYLQDGFGPQYTTYLDRTLKVLNTDDMLIELKGNKITATVSFWVKPQGNFDDPDNMTFDACTYWEGTPRSNTAVALVTATTTPSWTPGSVIQE